MILQHSLELFSAGYSFLLRERYCVILILNTIMSEPLHCLLRMALVTFRLRCSAQNWKSICSPYTDIDEVIFITFPDGFGTSGTCLLLKKAFYGLTRSSLL